MRRKNRQIKLYLSIPESYADEEAFMRDFMDKMDDGGWSMKIQNQNVPVHKIVLGDIEIEPEPEEEK